jgi:hypothetical protein
MQNPLNYKTQNGLLKAISRWSDKNVFTGWLYQNTKHALVTKWGWSEEQASRYTAGYISNTPVFSFGYAS